MASTLQLNYAAPPNTYLIGQLVGCQDKSTLDLSTVPLGPDTGPDVERSIPTSRLLYMYVPDIAATWKAGIQLGPPGTSLDMSTMYLLGDLGSNLKYKH